MTTENSRTKKKGLLKYLIPSLVGIVLGMGAYLVYISNAHSYLSDDPKACINCHIMSPEYASWFHSSHGRNTTCNDCHVPHDNVFRTYYFKAMDGMRHATIFTANTYDHTIKMLSPGQTVVQENCIRCHNQLNNAQVSTGQVTASMAHAGEGKLCWECHRDVPHGNQRGLTSSPDARVPLTEEPTPDWLKNLINIEKTKEENNNKMSNNN